MNVAYQRALKVAQELIDKQRIAKIQTELTILHGHQSRIEDALEYAQAALTYYERIKDVSKIATIYVNIAASFTNAGNHRAAIEPAQKSFTHYQQAKDPYRVAIAVANLAECFFEIGDSTQAEQFAYQAIEQEEAHVFPLSTLSRISHWGAPLIKDMPGIRGRHNETWPASSLDRVGPQKGASLRYQE